MKAYKTEFLSLLSDAISVLKQEQPASSFCFGNREDVAFFKLDISEENTAKVIPKQPVTNRISISQEKVDVAVPDKKIASVPLVTVERKLSENVSKPSPKVKAPPPASDPDAQIRELLKKAAPNLRLCTHIPDDSQAKKISESWKEQFYKIDVAVLALGETGLELQFLQNLARAIDVNLRPAKVIDGAPLETEKKWDLFLAQDSLKWVICSPQINRFPELLRLLPQKKLLALDPIDSYISNPALKASLWKTIKNSLND